MAIPSLLVRVSAVTIAGSLACSALRAQTVGDVFVIALENHNFTQPNPASSPGQLFGSTEAPFINSLVTVGNPNALHSSYASDYLGTGVHPSEPNYVWSEAGTNLGVTTDGDPFNANGTVGNVQNTPYHLTGLLQAAGVSWKSYQEDTDVNSTTGAVLPQNQWTVPLASASGTFTTANQYNGSDQYYYAAKHNPQVFFQDTNGGFDKTASNPLAKHYAPLQQLSADLTNKTVARYNWISPDLNNDMHNAAAGGFTDPRTHVSYTGDAANIAQGDYFLSKIVPTIEASAAWKNDGAIVIWTDETEGGNTSAYTSTEIVISPLAKGNAYDSTVPYSHSSDLKTWQELFDVGADEGYVNPLTDENSVFLGDAASIGVNDLSNLFVTGAIPNDIPNILVPEPSSAVLAGAGLLIMAVSRRRRIPGIPS